MRYPVLPAGAFIAAFLILIPGFWHWPKRHVPTLSMFVWLFATNVIYGVDSLVWSDGVRNEAPVWCDISTKIIIGASVALPACTLRLCKHLAMIGAGQKVRLDSKDRRRIAMFDFGVCWGFPVIFMALHYTVQGHRYNIIQYIGCRATTYTSILGLLIVFITPLLLSIGTSVYAGIALYHFVQTRRALSSVLQAPGSPMSANMYVRLMAMSVTLMLWVTTVAALMVWVNTVHGLRPSVSWEKVHLNWNRASRFLWAKYTPLDRMLQLFIWWSVPSSTAVSFLFLGFGEDALEGYRKIGDAIVRIISSRVLPNRGEKSRKGISPVSPLPPSGSSLGGPSPPLPTNAPTTNQTFQELLPIQPSRSLYSMIWPSRSKTQSQLSGKSYGWRWSARSEKSCPSTLDSVDDDDEGKRNDCTSRMRSASVAEPRAALIRECVQETIQGQEPHDQV